MCILHMQIRYGQHEQGVEEPHRCVCGCCGAQVPPQLGPQHSSRENFHKDIFSGEIILDCTSESILLHTC